MYTFEAETKSTKNGFKHTIYVYDDGDLLFKKNVNYLNRTWESYQYKTAFTNAIDKMGLSDKDKQVCFNIIDNKTSFSDASAFVETYLNTVMESDQ